MCASSNQHRVTPSHPLMSSSEDVEAPSKWNSEPVIRWTIRSWVTVNHFPSPMRLIHPSIAGLADFLRDR